MMWNTMTMIFIFLIKVSASEHVFRRTMGSVNLRFKDAEVIPGARSKVECTSKCDQKSWCNAISWDQNTKTCQGFTRTLDQESIPSHVTYVYTSEKVVCLGEGYTNTSGMCIRFFPDLNMDWFEATDHCFSEGGRLVVADTMNKYIYVVNQLRNDPALRDSTNFWVGAQKVNEEWTWTTGEVLSKDLSVLDNQRDLAFCLGFYLNGLDDHGCHWSAKPICEK